MVNDFKPGDVVILKEHVHKAVIHTWSSTNIKQIPIKVSNESRINDCTGCDNIGLGHEKQNHCNNKPTYIKISDLDDYSCIYGSYGYIPSCKVLYELYDTRTELSKFINNIYEEEKEKQCRLKKEI